MINVGMCIWLNVHKGNPKKGTARQRAAMLLACLSALVLVIVLGGLALAFSGCQGQSSPSSLQTDLQPPSVPSTPGATSTFPSLPTQPPLAQPIQPFPPTLRAEISTLEAHDRFFFHGNTRLPEVALTFDDGPSPAYTPLVLAILKRYHIRATFFAIGRLVEAYPELVRQELSEGHIVGNHTWTHADLPWLSSNAIRRQLQRTSDEITQVLGVQPIFLRPPYGAISARVLRIINSMGLTTVLWNDEAKDWALPGSAVIVARILKLASNGAIILLHDGGGFRAQTVQALPAIIEHLRARGFTFVTMAELVAHMHKNQETPTLTSGRPIHAKLTKMKDIGACIHPHPPPHFDFCVHSAFASRPR